MYIEILLLELLPPENFSAECGDFYTSGGNDYTVHVPPNQPPRRRGGGGGTSRCGVDRHVSAELLRHRVELDVGLVIVVIVGQ